MQKVATRGRAAPSRCAVSPLNETAQRGRRELCTLSSVQPLVLLIFVEIRLSLVVEKFNGRSCSMLTSAISSRIVL